MRGGAWAGVLLLLVAACAEETQDEPAPPKAPPTLPDVSHLERPAIRAIEDAHKIAVGVGDAVSWTFYGRTLFAHDLNVAAEEACLFATETRGPVPFEAWYFAGLGAAFASHERAAEYLRRAIDMRPGYQPAHLRLGMLLEQMGDLEGAEESYGIALQLAPSSHALLGLARVEFERGNDRQALRALQEARNMDPSHAEVTALLAQVLTRLGDHESARRAAADVDDAHRSTPFPDPVLGETLLLCNSYQGLVDGIHAQQGGGDIAAALALAERCLRYYPEMLEAHTQYADLLRRVGRLDLAAAEYRAALELDPKQAIAKSLLGLTIAEMGRPEEGERLMREAVTDAPERIDPRYNLAYFLAAGREKEAREILEQLVRDAPNHTESRMLLAGVSLTLGDRDRAISELRIVLRQEPTHARARRILADLTR
jgi:Tfp pilus assembly protein PilF